VTGRSSEGSRSEDVPLAAALAILVRVGIPHRGVGHIDTFSPQVVKTCKAEIWLNRAVDAQSQAADRERKLLRRTFKPYEERASFALSVTFVTAIRLCIC
jgi:hypothetical protein